MSASQVAVHALARTVESPARGRGALVYSVSLFTLAAAAIHLAAAPEHLAEYVLYGYFFVGLGLAQAALAVALIAQPSRRLFVGSAIGTLLVIALWTASRTTGLPIAPVPWRPEAVGFPDVTATVLEGVSYVFFLLLLRKPEPRRRGHFRVALATTPSLLISALAGFLGTGAALSPMAPAFSAAPATASSISVASLVAPAGGEPVKAFTLTARATTVGGQPAWTYDGTVPGPELHVTQGDRVRVTLVNRLPAASSIHWHGIVLPNAEDGVAGLTQNAVPPGASFTYEFVARDAGTYWYHSHQDTSHQLAAGLFGALIVEPKGGAPAIDRDYSLLIHYQPGYRPGYGTLLVNGSRDLHLAANPGETVRLRLIDAIEATGMGADGQVEEPVLLGAPYAIAALDGHDLNQPQQLGPERIFLGMGQRADLVFKMPASGSVRLTGLKSSQPLLPWDPKQSTSSVTIGEGPAPAALDIAKLPRFDLTSYGLPAADRLLEASRFDVDKRIDLTGGGPAFRNGSFGFADTINHAAAPNIAPIRVRSGDLVRLRVVNHSQQSHPIHIHGHVFTVLARNGQPLSGSPVHLDAILVGPGESWDVGFVADNPGIWMLHCHVLNHAAGGMSMTVNYDGYSTPFTMGSQSGNEPE